MPGPARRPCLPPASAQDWEGYSGHSFLAHEMGIIIACFLRAVVRIIAPKRLSTGLCLEWSMDSINGCQAARTLASHPYCRLRLLSAVCCLSQEAPL